ELLLAALLALPAELLLLPAQLGRALGSGAPGDLRLALLPLLLGALAPLGLPLGPVVARVAVLDHVELADHHLLPVGAAQDDQAVPLALGHGELDGAVVDLLDRHDRVAE